MIDQNVYRSVFKFENTNSDRGRKHSNWSNHVWTPEMQNMFGAAKGDSFIGQDGKTYYTAKYNDLETGDRASRYVIDKVWNETNQDPLEFASRYTGYEKDNPIVQNYAQDILANMNQSRVSQTIDQNRGRVQQAIDEAERQQLMAKEQEMIQSKVLDLVKAYPESYSQIRSMVKEGIYDLETITEVASQLKKTDEPKEALNFFDKIKEFKHIPNALELIPFVSGAKQIQEMTELVGAARALENDTITPEQTKLLQDYIEFSERDKTFGFKVAEVVAAMPAFMGEIALTGGIASAGRKAAGETAEQLLRKVLTDSAKKKLDNIVSKGAGRLVRKSARAVAGETVRAPVSGATRIPAETLERTLPNLQLDDEEKLIVTGPGESALDALTNATKNQWIEMIAERSGGLFNELGRPAKEAIARTALIKGWKKSNPGKTTRALNETLRKGGFNGILAEIGEERFGEIARATPGIGTGEELPDYTSPEFLEQVMVEAASFAVPSGVRTAANLQVRRKKETPKEEVKQKPKKARPKQTKAVDEINAAVEAGETTEGTAKVAKLLVEQDPSFDSRASLEISQDVLELTDDYIKKELGKDPDKFFEEEGITREEAEAGEFTATGSTARSYQKGQIKTAIKLYKGHDADTVVEEFYHDYFEFLTPKEKAAFSKYHKDRGDKRSVNEMFGQEGRDFFFSEKLHEKAGGIRGLFEGARDSLSQLIGRIRKIRGAKIPKAIQNIYRKAGLRDLSKTRINRANQRGKDLTFQVRRKGVFVGAPKGVDTPSKLRTMRDRVDELVSEGKVGKDWYDNSADAALRLTGGNIKEAEMVLDLIAITSPSMPVKTNTGQMVKLLYQIAQGDIKGAGRFPGTVKKQVEGLLEGKKLSELMKDAKVVSFAENLKRSLTKADDNRVTVDVWMQRAYGYENEVPTDAQYRFVAKDVRRIATKMGWTPKQTQAAIWVGAKSRWETINGNKMPLKSALRKMKSTPADPKKLALAKTDYADAMKVYEGRISYEYIPSTKSKTLPGIHNASYEEKMEYHMDMNKALLNDKNKNIIAKELGIPEVRSLDGPGFWETAVSPSRQMEVLVSSKASEKEINKKIGDDYYESVETFNSIIGLLFKQDAVATTKEFVAPSKIKANATGIFVEEGLSEEEFAAINKELGDSFDITPTSYGGIVINFMDYSGQPDKKKPNYNKNYGKPFSEVDNNTFHTIVYNAVEKGLQNSDKDVNLERSLSTGRLNYGGPNGKDYRQRISESKQQDAAIRIYNKVYKDVQAVNERYSKKYNWGNAGELKEYGQEVTFQVRAKTPTTKVQKPTESLQLDPENTRQLIQRKIQDSMARLGHVIEGVRSKRKVNDEEDLYLAAELYTGKVAEKITDFERSIYDSKGSLFDRIVKAGYSIDDFGLYLHARHAQERNEHIAKINEDLPDGGSGMTNEEAKEILNQYRGDKKIKTFAQEYYRKVTKRSLRERRNAGLIDQETYERLNTYYKNYVPLFVVQDEGSMQGMGQGFSVPQGSEIKRAKGSEKTRANPAISGLVSTVGAMNRAEKNKVGLKFLDLAREFKSNAWGEVKAQRFVPQFNSDGEMIFMRPEYKPADNIFAVREKGKLRFIEIKDKALLNALKNLGTNTTRLPDFLYTATDYFRRIVTTYNPEFIITNFERDLQSALIHIKGETNVKSKDVLKVLPSAMKGIYRNVKQKEGGYWADRYEDLKKAGGRVGYFNIESLEQKLNTVEKRLKKVQEGKMTFASGGRAFGELINNVNEAVESGIRLATFDALVKKGMTEKRAAQYAKNLTVNFNKKGEWGQIANTLYMFSNATIQSGFRIGVALGRSNKVRMIAAGITGLTSALSYINYLIAPDEWEKIPQWQKDNYLIFMLGNGDDIRLRVPYGYNVFHVAGQIVGELSWEGSKPGAKISELDYGKNTWRFFKSISDAFSPFGDGSFFQAVSPTLLDPVVQLVENKKFHGGPIRPDQPQYGPRKRRSDLIWEKKLPTRPAKYITDTLSDYYVELNPYDLDYIFEFITGGVGRFVSRSVETGMNFVQGKKQLTNDIPFVRQFYGQRDQRGISERSLVYDYMKNSIRKKYNPTQVRKFERYVRDAIRLNALPERLSKEVTDENGKKMPRVLRDFYNNQREAYGLEKIDYRKTGKKKRIFPL